MNISAKYNYPAIFILLAALIFLVLGANPSQQTIAPVDLFAHYGGFRSVEFPNHVEYAERSDVIDVIIPSWKRAKERWRNGNGLNWRSLGNLSQITFYLVDDDALGIYIGVFLKLFIAALGMYLFLSLLTAHFLARLFGAITFTFSAFNSGWLFWSQVDTIAWLPWLLWSTTAYLQEKDYRYLMGISLTSLLMITAWFPAVAAFGFYAFSLLTLLWTIYHYQGFKTIVRNFIVPHIFVGIGFFASSYFILSSVQVINRNNVLAQRFGTTSLELQHFKLFLDPYATGLPHPEFGIYSGIVALLLAIGSIGVFLFLAFKRKDNQQSGLFYLYGIILLLGMIVLGFGLISHDFIRLIPPFKNNAWNRITVMGCFALALLASLFINFIQSQAKKRVLQIGSIILFTLLTAYQFYDLKILANDLNAVVDKGSFYPTTPTIRYLQQHTDKNDKVLADYSFGVPGLLRYYDLHSWYDHAFKTATLRELLEKLIPDAFVSNTAASFEMNRVTDLKSPLMDILGFKYMTTAYPLTKNIPPLPTGDDIPLLMTPFKPYNQKFQLADTVVAGGVSAFFGTYSEIVLETSRFKLSITNLTDSTTVYNEIFKDISFNNNQWFTFDFTEPISFIGGQEYEISFLVFDDVDLAVWSKGGTNLQFSLQPVDLYAPEWKKISVEQGVTLFENQSLPDGAYLVENLEQLDDSLTYQNLLVEQSRGKITIDIKGLQQPAWLVLPIREQVGGYFVDGTGQVLEYAPYLDIFPAAKVTSAGTITYQVQKNNSKQTAIILSMIAITLLSLTFIFKTKIESFLHD